MLTHGYWHDFTVSILKCEEVMKIYRDHPYGLKLYHFILPCHFYITQHLGSYKKLPVIQEGMVWLVGSRGCTKQCDSPPKLVDILGHLFRDLIIITRLEIILSSLNYCVIFYNSTPFM